MDDRVSQFRVGAVVICGILVTGILILFSGDIDWIFQRQYSLFVDSPTAPGVSRNTPVRKHGIRIGYVSDIETKDRGVRLMLKIDGDQKLYENDVCKIGTASFLGDAVIDFLPGLDPARGGEIENGALIAYNANPNLNRVLVDINPVEMISKFTEIDFSRISASVEKLPEAIEAVRDAGRSIEKAGDNVAAFTGRFGEVLGGEDIDVGEIAANIRNLSAKAETAVENFNSLMVNINEVVGNTDAKASLLDTIKEAPQLLKDAKLAVAETRETLDSFRQLATRAEVNLKNIEGFTEALGEQGPELAEQLNASFEGANEIIAQLKQFSESLNSSEGSLGKLLNDPKLYQDISETVANVRDISFKLKPIINDARYLMDGLARDPGQIVRGAFDRRPNNSGYKGTLMGNGKVYQ